MRFQFARVSSSESKFAKESTENYGIGQSLVLQIWRLSLQAWKQVLQIMRSTLFWERNSKEIPLGSTRRIRNAPGAIGLTADPSGRNRLYGAVSRKLSSKRAEAGLRQEHSEVENATSKKKKP